MTPLDRHGLTHLVAGGRPFPPEANPYFPSCSAEARFHPGLKAGASSEEPGDPKLRRPLIAFADRLTPEPPELLWGIIQTFGDRRGPADGTHIVTENVVRGPTAKSLHTPALDRGRSVNPAGRRPLRAPAGRGRVARWVMRPGRIPRRWHGGG